jgi:hypothetical protein
MKSEIKSFEYEYQRTKKILDFIPQCRYEEKTFEKVSKHCRHNGPQFMNLIKKNLILFIIIGILGSGIPVITLCSSYCVSSNLDLDSPMDGSCPFADHSFVQIAIVLSALFVLPLAGLFLVRDRQFIPPGVYWPLFKPPRFSL